MSAPRLDSETKDKIVAEYLAGVKIHEIAKRFRVDPSYPGLLARRRGVALRQNCTRDERGGFSA